MLMIPVVATQNRPAIGQPSVARVALLEDRLDARDEGILAGAGELVG